MKLTYLTLLICLLYNISNAQCDRIDYKADYGVETVFIDSHSIIMPTSDPNKLPTILFFNDLSQQEMNSIVQFIEAIRMDNMMKQTVSKNPCGSLPKMVFTPYTAYPSPSNSNNNTTRSTNRSYNNTSVPTMQFSPYVAPSLPPVLSLEDYLNKP